MNPLIILLAAMLLFCSGSYRYFSSGYVGLGYGGGLLLIAVVILLIRNKERNSLT